MPTEREPPAPLPPAGGSSRPPVDPLTLEHKSLVDGPFWQRIPAYRGVTEAEFLDHVWQTRHTITRVPQLVEVLGDLLDPELASDIERGYRHAPMSVRATPYSLSLIDWSAPYDDPLRKQFITLASRRLPDHPRLELDSLHEREDSPVSGVTHRYRDRALFLATESCPAYCRFCTRSYAVGGDTGSVEKVRLGPAQERWAKGLEYIASRPEIEDVVVSGGDCYTLRPEQITEVGDALLAMPNVRRVRFATKGPAVMPQKILGDDAWVDALVGVVERGRALHKAVMVHTHFNHPREITAITQAATNRLFERGVLVRNQTVLQRGVNDSPETMTLLVKRLGFVNVLPYYVFVHDQVQGVEDLRTSLDTALRLERQVRGCTAGFLTPTFAVDAPGGGGKRDAHSYDYYDRESGISVFTAPCVKPGATFLYFDPLDQLHKIARRRWAIPAERDVMVRTALACARQHAG